MGIIMTHSLEQAHNRVIPPIFTLPSASCLFLSVLWSYMHETFLWLIWSSLSCLALLLSHFWPCYFWIYNISTSPVFILLELNAHVSFHASDVTHAAVRTMLPQCTLSMFFRPQIFDFFDHTFWRMTRWKAIFWPFLGEKYPPHQYLECLEQIEHSVVHSSFTMPKRLSLQATRWIMFLLVKWIAAVASAPLIYYSVTREISICFEVFSTTHVDQFFAV